MKYQLILVAALAAVAFATVAPSRAHACTPIWSGETLIVSSDAPECLAFSGTETISDGVHAYVDVTNSCAELATLTCIGAESCAALELATGSSIQMTVPWAAGTEIQWTLGNSLGSVAYDLDGTWSNCGGGGGCAAGGCSVTGVGSSGSTALGLVIVFLALLRANRRRLFAGSQSR